LGPASATNRSATNRSATNTPPPPNPTAGVAVPALRCLPLGPAHLEACLALAADALAAFWSREQWRRELTEPDRPTIGLLDAHGELVALACGWQVLDELHITALAVRPSWRRQGLGRSVLSELLREGRRRGALHATLEVAAGNAAARALYGAAGFETAGCRRGYYRNGDDALIQWRRLNAEEG
jgi:ribosomal-protein-alanine N-acetyltransferase